ncbi:MAG: hypothetical protein QOF90_3644, partial [Acetobacteraceae bacterium]|nr:hypothetical protein [Acetobacteraceae bacterium]
FVDRDQAPAWKRRITPHNQRINQELRTR